MLDGMKAPRGPNDQLGKETHRHFKAGQCDPAIFILANDMTLRSSNMAANRILGAESFITIDDGRVIGVTEKADQHLNALISSANDRGHRALLDGKLVSGEQAADSWIAVSRRFGGQAIGDGLVMMSLRSLAKSEPLPGRDVMWIFGLTPAEARLAVQLAAGFPLADIADRNGVNISTLRAQLRSVYAKTGTGKQSELVAHIWRAAGV